MSFERSPEVGPEYREASEGVPHYELMREHCLDRLVSQVSGRQVDNFADEFLIEGVNNAYTDNTDNGYRLECQTERCTRACEMVPVGGGVIELNTDSVEGSCFTETSVSIGSLALG